MGPATVIEAAGPAFSVTIDDLVELSSKAGYERATRRTIHHWRSRGFISAPFRLGPERRYPIEAVGQIDCLARFPPRLYGTDRSTVALFIEVGALPWEQARDSLCRLLSAWAQDLDDSRERLAEDPELLTREGAASAAKRGKRALPRVVRQAADERALAHTHVLAGGLGLHLDAATRAAGQRALETMFGLRGGRGGAALDLAGLVDDPADSHLDPRSSLAAIAAASTPAIELARRLTEMLVLWFPLLFASVWDEAPKPFLALALTATQQITPDFHAWFFAYCLSKLADQDPTLLSETLDDFDTATAAAELYRELPPNAARNARDDLRPLARAQLRLALSLTDPGQAGA